MISSSPCLRYSLICPASTFAAPIERIFPFFQCVQRIYSLCNRRKTGLYGLPVGHRYQWCRYQPLQAGFHLFANRLRREIFVQLTIANFVKQAARPLPDDATFGFDNDIVTRQLFQRLPDNHFTVAKFVSRRGINQINAAAMRLDNGINAKPANRDRRSMPDRRQ